MVGRFVNKHVKEFFERDSLTLSSYKAILFFFFCRLVFTTFLTH